MFRFYSRLGWLVEKHRKLPNDIWFDVNHRPVKIMSFFLISLVHWKEKKFRWLCRVLIKCQITHSRLSLDCLRNLLIIFNLIYFRNNLEWAKRVGFLAKIISWWNSQNKCRNIVLRPLTIQNFALFNGKWPKYSNSNDCKLFNVLKIFTIPLKYEKSNLSFRMIFAIRESAASNGYDDYESDVDRWIVNLRWKHLECSSRTRWCYPNNKNIIFNALRVLQFWVFMWWTLYGEWRWSTTCER